MIIPTTTVYVPPTIPDDRHGDGFEVLQTRSSRLVRDALPLITQLSRLRRGGTSWSWASSPVPAGSSA